MKKDYIFGVLIAVLCCIAACVVGSCSGAATDAGNFDEYMQDASLALADGDYEQAQILCDGLLAVTSGADSASVEAAQVARLGIMFMKLAERRGEEENVANATQCLRLAMHMSGDSLKAFSSSLQLDDQRHFVLLRRIGMSLDNR